MPARPAAGGDSKAAAEDARAAATARKVIVAFGKLVDGHFAKIEAAVATQTIPALRQRLEAEASALRDRRTAIDGLDPVEGAQEIKRIDAAAHALSLRASGMQREAAQAQEFLRTHGEQPLAASQAVYDAAGPAEKAEYGPWLQTIARTLASARRELGLGNFDAVHELVARVHVACRNLDSAIATFAAEKPKYDELRKKVATMVERLRGIDSLGEQGRQGVAALQAALQAADVVGQRRGYVAAQAALQRVVADGKQLRESGAAYKEFGAEKAKVASRLDAVRKHAQAGNLKAEIDRIARHLKDAEALSKASEAGALKGLTALKAAAKECDQTLALAARLAAAAAKLPVLTKKLEAGGVPKGKVKDTARMAIKLLVEERCSDDEAVRMARDASGFQDEGLSEPDAIVSSRVKKSLTDGGLDEAHAKSIGRNLRAGGTATADDAKALAQAMKGVSKDAIDTLNKAGIVSECCRGPVTDAMPELAGVQPRGWPDTATWDEVPGVYNPSVKKVVVGTKANPDGSRKVPVSGEGPLPHGAADLFGHEAGHAYDAAPPSGKSADARFIAARQADVTAQRIKGRRDGGRDDYFLTVAEGGANDAGATSETFAESFAMHAIGTLAGRWPSLAAFWSSGPFPD